mgnify:FL=1
MAHIRLGGDIAQRNIRQRLAVNAALECHEYFHAHGFLVNDKRHIYLLCGYLQDRYFVIICYQVVNKNCED